MSKWLVISTKVGTGLDFSVANDDQTVVTAVNDQVTTKQAEIVAIVRLDPSVISKLLF